MSNDPVDGGTVRYHRCDYHSGTDEPWLVWFTKDQADPYWFTAEQGEAMGLTVPSPAESEVAELVDRYGATGVGLALLAHDDVTNVDDFLDGLLDRWMSLRDARQDPQPTADTPSDDIDFDALPIGTVLKTYNGYYVTKGGNGNWFDSEQAHGRPDQLLAPYTVVYQPAPLSPRQHLEALLAGRDDAAREMLSLPRTWSAAWMDVVAGAARGGA